MASSALPRLRRHAIRLYAVWPGDDHARPQYGGLEVLIPPVRTVAVSGGSSPYRFASPVDGMGRPIPGAVLLESVVSLDPATQGIRTEFDAVEWAEGLESNNRALFARGFKIVDSIEEIVPAQEAGRPMWEAKMQEHWLNVLAAERRRRQRDEKEGKPFTDGHNAAAVREAIAGLNALSKKQRELAVPDAELDRLLGVAKGPVGVVPPPAAPQEPAKVEDKTLAVVSERLLTVAQKHNVRLTNAETMGLFKQNEDVMRAIEAKLQAAGVDLEAEMAAGQ